MEFAEARDLLDGEAARLARARGLVDSELAPGTYDEDAAEDRVDVGRNIDEREMESALAEDIERNLVELAAARQRLDAGTYGSCEVCGGPIGDERLRALPLARRCVKDQAGRPRA